jgi:Ca2+-transporting ATPase
MRSDKSLFKIGPFGNSTLNLAALASLALVCFVLFVPGVMTAFGLVYLTPKLYLIAAGLILVPTVVMEFCKLVGLIKEK